MSRPRRHGQVEDFVDQLSNWYVRRNRRRFWKEGKSLDKQAAYQTLYECLVDLAKLISPIAPFLGEWLYQRLNQVTEVDEESVHISFYPTVEETAIDKQLEHRMQLARQVSSMVLSLRNKLELNVRQPLARIILPIDNEEDRHAVESVKEIILDEVNVKEVQFVDDDSGIVHKTAKPNYPLLGEKLGSKMKPVASKVAELTTEEITAYEETGSIELDLGDEGIVQLGSDGLEITRTGLEGWSVETEDGLSVALDTEMTPELVKEGLAREFVNRIQNMRKEADFDVVDRITIGFEGSDKLEDAVESMKDYIKSETLAEEIATHELEVSDFIKSWEIGDGESTISIRRNPN
ncbi:MAG: DUF5915 domain-containing protein [Fodinibius sp.]|nr:DUF5915 domain-containing protein [Fodinibius sp.]